MFARPILVVTTIEVLDFIALNDAIIDRFYGGDLTTYFRFGEASAERALREGPYHQLARPRLGDLHQSGGRHGPAFTF